MSEVILYEVNRPGSDLPRWRRSAAITADGSIVFIPASVTDSSEQAVGWAASHDGIQVVRHAGHLYFPARWIAANYPETVEVAWKIEEMIRERHAKE